MRDILANTIFAIAITIGGMASGQIRTTENEMTQEQSFAQWQSAFRTRAINEGIRAVLFDDVFRSVQPLEKIIALDQSQGEFTRSIWDYIERAVSDKRIADGYEMMRKHARSLSEIEREYGVEKEILAAIWGIETHFGTNRGDTPTLAALATLAHEGRRRDFFEAELIAALQIIQNGDISAQDMIGSWAGAMGHTQFMPTSWWTHAADFDGDGRKDIWGEDPVDALASTAQYLRNMGWQTGQPWAIEVTLPNGFNYDLAERSAPLPISDWRRLGVTAASGAQLKDHGPAALLLPAGAYGPALLIFENFKVIGKYNLADAYILSVGHLSDRLGAGAPFYASWPRHMLPLTRDDKTELQARLTNAGFDTKGIDGQFGTNSARALKAWQNAKGYIPDGFAHQGVLAQIRQNP